MYRLAELLEENLAERQGFLDRLRLARTSLPRATRERVRISLLLLGVPCCSSLLDKLSVLFPATLTYHVRAATLQATDFFS